MIPEGGLGTMVDDPATRYEVDMDWTDSFMGDSAKDDNDKWDAGEPIYEMWIGAAVETPNPDYPDRNSVLA